MTDLNSRNRLTGVLLLISPIAMVAGAAIVVPSGLTLNPSDPGAALAAVGEQTVLHMTELALDVLGWLALTAAGLALAARPADAPRPHMVTLSGGLLTAAGLAGLLHDAGNLALTRLAVDPAAPAATTVALALMLTAKWVVNLAGLLWVAATAAGAAGIPMPAGLRIAGMIAALSGLAGAALPWTTGTGGPTVALEQLGYALHLPIMIWYGTLGWRYLAGRRRQAM
ncbi:hypothetical protein [Planobispora longispora]|uniref:DUF4386 family protein n=1 Tax=Planobispora longispora TaxID=28887 RepID=A0A8J3RMP2_9ACTN|nr:hypothetical protein [Planobispora longispora]BFE87698.1 hypothetical protein GCM10020093_102990 [Planobispora longispora]GIH77744.1 hypothetical protein Plo01_41730 [Planobispora longispora]